ncbi:MAG: hypothetical protein LAP40_23795 [Acidobacteriia bacterium]|nr:hypothetical protein [Terriglobia bacterium]
MSACATCRHSGIPQRAPSALLLQIRRGYRTRWNNLAFSVETDSSQWTLRVQEPGKSQPLYTAHRGGAHAAQVAAAEFAIFLRLGPASSVRPDRLAQELTWQEYW